MTACNRREREIADGYVESFRKDTDPMLILSLADVLARYREELLVPFEALRVDLQASGDERAARCLDRLLWSAHKGKP